MVCNRCILALFILLQPITHQTVAHPSLLCEDEDRGCLDYIKLGDSCDSEWVQKFCRATCGCKTHITSGLQAGSHCLPVIQGVDKRLNVRHAIWTRTVEQTYHITWNPSQNCTRHMSGFNAAQCLVNLPRRRVVLAGDSNFVKLIDHITGEWWNEKNPLFAANFEVHVISANDAEYANHRMGQNAWWQDMEILITERRGEKRSALLSFRFQHGGFDNEGVNLTQRTSTIVSDNFKKLTLKDGMTQWTDSFIAQMPKAAQELRAQLKSDIFFFCPGLWGLKEWIKRNVSERATARDMVRQSVDIVREASATRRVWVTTGRTDGITRGFAPGIVAQRDYALSVIDFKQANETQYKYTPDSIPLLLLDWWAISDLTEKTVLAPGQAPQTQGPVLADFSHAGGFHLNLGARVAHLGLIFNEICGMVKT